MTFHLNRPAGAIAIALSTGLMTMAPVQAATTQAFAQFSNIDFSFSDASGAIDPSTVSILSKGIIFGQESIDYLFNQKSAGLAATSNSGHDAAFSLMSSSSFNGLSSSAQNLALPISLVSAASLTSFSGSFYIAPHSTVTVSADYSLSASMGKTMASSDYQSAALTLYAHDPASGGGGFYKVLFASTDEASHDAGSLSHVWLNDSASGYYQNFEFQANANLQVFGIAQAVPEPGTWAMSVFGLALTGIGAWRQRARSAAAS